MAAKQNSSDTKFGKYLKMLNYNPTLCVKLLALPHALQQTGGISATALNEMRIHSICYS